MENHGKLDEDFNVKIPTPYEFDKYVPYACNQLQLSSAIVVIKILQNEYVSSVSTDRSKKLKIRMNQSRNDLGSDFERDKTDTELFTPMEENIVKIIAVYDTTNNLVEIRFDKNKNIPTVLLKVIGLILNFHSHLTSIVINSGIDKYTLYEINKFLSKSNISDICLDNCYLKEANFYILLETVNNLRYLSLSNCKINDKVIEMISKRLVYPSSASKTLLILNLSLNKVTDEGAKYLAEALRSNRKLSYLNLADNSLTDAGVGAILDSLLEFPMSYEEILSARSRHVLFLRDKETMVQQIMKELRVNEFERKQSTKRKPIKTIPLSGKKGKLDKESSVKSLEPNRSLIFNMDSLFYVKALAMAENTLGEFKDPHGSGNTITKDEVIYCLGNNTLSYLNLAYNNLTYLTIRKLLKVFKHQRYSDRQTRGLVNVLIEGNLMPNSCKELTKIDDIIDIGLTQVARNLSVNKKKGPVKSAR